MADEQECKMYLYQGNEEREGLGEFLHTLARKKSLPSFMAQGRVIRGFNDSLQMPV